MAQVLILARPTFFHSVATMLTVVDVYAFIYGLEMVEMSTYLLQLLDTHVRADPLKFMTFWNMLLQCLYFSFTLLIDLMGLNTTLTSNQNKPQYIKDLAFASWLFPTGMWVSSSFWVLYCMNGDLILPERIAILIPSWVNHSVHSLPAVLVILELWLVPHKYPTRYTGMVSLYSLFVAYSLYMVSSSLKSGMWPYPILTVLSPLQLFVLLATLTASPGIHYIIGEKLNILLWDVNARNKLSTNFIEALATPPSALISVILLSREPEPVICKSELSDCRQRRHSIQSVQDEKIPKISITPSP